MEIVLSYNVLIVSNVWNVCLVLQRMEIYCNNVVKNNLIFKLL